MLQNNQWYGMGTIQPCLFFSMACVLNKMLIHVCVKTCVVMYLNQALYCF